jgi:hypothetical protein
MFDQRSMHCRPAALVDIQSRNEGAGVTPTPERPDLAVSSSAVARPPQAASIAPPRLARATSLPVDFAFGQVPPAPRVAAVVAAAPSLGPLAAFVGNWHGGGFNTIFRPDSPETPTPLPQPAGGDNVLELNLTWESLSFSASLGSVPNRGMVQADAFLNGVPYLQAISDVTVGTPTGIHLEPGLWMAVPPTTDPAEGPTVVRMASIPHGTTICAQGTSRTFGGAPTIPAVDITPFVTGSPGSKIPFPSQQATNGGTARIPQDLTTFISAGTITQAVLGDPNSLLRSHISGLPIVSTTEISISTAPAAPLFGGGTDNIAFLLGNAAGVSGQNAQTLQMSATFWIETVQHTIIVPPFELGERPLTLRPQSDIVGRLAPAFTIRPPFPIPIPRPITVTSHQIQYSQMVELNFNGLTWPHVSVATLVPASPQTVPPSVWS